MEEPISTKHLHPEIWSRIIRFLRKPRYLPGLKVRRSHIRQHDLSSMMRVSKTMYDLTGPTLYTHIIADDLARLIIGHDTPSQITGIKSKNELFSYTKRLFLKYPEERPTYSTIMLSGDTAMWRDVSRSSGVLSMFEMSRYKQRLSAAISFQTGSLTDIFPSLHTLSVGTYFGGPVIEWAERWTMDASRFETYLPMQRYIMRTITGGQLQHFCQSDNIGPLSVPKLTGGAHVSDASTFAAPNVTSCCQAARLTVHITSRSRLPWACWDFSVVLGARTRWCFDDSLFEGTDRDNMMRAQLENQYYPIMNQSGQSLVNQIISRERYLVEHPATNREDCQVQLGIIAPVYNPSDSPATAAKLKDEPTAAGLNAEELRTAAQRFEQNNMGEFYWKHYLEAIRQEGFKHDGIEKEGFKMFRISDCPPCPACDWEPPNARKDNPWYMENLQC